MMATIQERMQEAENLLHQAQQAPGHERLWLMTVVWELLHDVVTDLGNEVAEQLPSRTSPEPRQLKDGLPSAEKRVDHRDLELRA